MKSARFIPVQNRLKQLVRAPGGRTVGETLKGATEALEAARIPTLEAVDEIVLAMEALGPEAPASAVYALASQVVDLAGYFDEPHLFAAAWSLCDLAQALTGGVQADPDSVVVHVRALKALRRPGTDDPALRAQILDGLRQVSIRAAST